MKTGSPTQTLQSPLPGIHRANHRTDSSQSLDNLSFRVLSFLKWRHYASITGKERTLRYLSKNSKYYKIRHTMIWNECKSNMKSCQETYTLELARRVHTVEQKAIKKFHNLALQRDVHISFSRTNRQQKHTRMHFYYFNSTSCNNQNHFFPLQGPNNELEFKSVSLSSSMRDFQ